MSYTPTFTPEYEDGWENLPSEDTPITAEALNGYDEAIEAIETYLSNNDIVSVEANPQDASTDSLTKIEIDGTVYSVSGDSATVLTATLTSGSTSLTFSNAAITTTAMYDVYADKYGLTPTNMTVTTGQAVLTFEAQSADVSVKLVIR